MLGASFLNDQRDRGRMAEAATGAVNGQRVTAGRGSELGRYRENRQSACGRVRAESA